MLAEANSLKGRAIQLQALEQAAGEIAAAKGAATVNAKEGTKGVGGPSQFKDWGDFLHAIWWELNPKNRSGPDPRLASLGFRDEAKGGHEAKDMTEGTGAAGGFLVPAEYLATLQAVQAERSIVRSRATIIRMRRRQVDIPVLDQTATTANQPHFFGGMQFTWAEEATQKTQSDPTFRRVTLDAHKLIGYTVASDELLDDAAVSLGDFLSSELGMAGGVSWMEDYAFLRGTGAGEPLGVALPAGATIVEGRAAAGAIGFDDLADMMQDFLPTGRGVWVVTQSALSSIIQMAGPAGTPSYIWQPNARDGIPGTMLGFPVIWTEKLPLLGQQGDILLADFRYYLLGDRQATTVESTQYDQWRYDKTSWRVVHRVDGQPWLSAPITLQDGTTQISPFVILGAAVGS